MSEQNVKIEEAKRLFEQGKYIDASSSMLDFCTSVVSKGGTLDFDTDLFLIRCFHKTSANNPIPSDLLELQNNISKDTVIKDLRLSENLEDFCKRIETFRTIFNEWYNDIIDNCFNEIEKDVMNYIKVYNKKRVEISLNVLDLQSVFFQVSKERGFSLDSYIDSRDKELENDINEQEVNDKLFDIANRKFDQLVNYYNSMRELSDMNLFEKVYLKIGAEYSAIDIILKDLCSTKQTSKGYNKEKVIEWMILRTNLKKWCLDGHLTCNASGLDLLVSEQRNSTIDELSEIYNNIKELNPEFEVPQLNYQKVTVNSGSSSSTSSGGCYVATCVYGSYDCPEVWTLRRYRDYYLAKTWYGRAFIYTYYAVSPTLVKWFGNTKWFKTMWRGKLNRMVKNLRSEGVEDTPYEDKEW